VSNPKSAAQPLAVNRKARHDYHISDTYEAGIMLTGAEVKAVRAGRLSLRDCYAKFDRHNELWLINAHIGDYQPGEQAKIEPTRRRKLLLHKSELHRLLGQANQKGLTLVPLAAYSSRGRIKIEVGLAKGKKLYDKKEDKKRADIKRDIQREIKSAHYKL